MLVILFSFIGVVFGYFVLGLDLFMMFNFGLIVVVGVVINDLLVMIDFVN